MHLTVLLILLLRGEVFIADVAGVQSSLARLDVVSSVEKVSQVFYKLKPTINKYPQ